VQSLHEGHHDHLQHLLQAQGRELARCDHINFGLFAGI
jgi:hypothetical protein